MTVEPGEKIRKVPVLDRGIWGENQKSPGGMQIEDLGRDQNQVLEFSHPPTPPNHDQVSIGQMRLSQPAHEEAQDSREDRIKKQFSHKVKERYPDDDHTSIDSPRP
jgi:hypothetical protein